MAKRSNISAVIVPEIDQEQIEPVETTESAPEQLDQEQIDPVESELSSVLNMEPVEMFRKFGSKSATIRYLDSSDLSRGRIAKLLGLRYQHVRNVLITPVKKSTV